jgi:hypothetical protein
MEDRDALISENQRLQKSRGRWRAIAIVGLLLVFVVMLPFITSTHEVVEYFKNRDTAAMQRRQDAELELRNRWFEEAEKEMLHLRRDFSFPKDWLEKAEKQRREREEREKLYLQTEQEEMRGAEKTKRAFGLPVYPVL